LVEEAPSPFIDAAMRAKMGEAAVKAVTAIRYEGVGTIEFLVDKYKNFYFMEMNTRIQVEHPVTEEVMDFDLIKEQILIAAGTPISGELYFPEKMHAIECRVNAEDPLNNFAPSPGKITALHTPKGYGVRVDTHIYAGYTVPPYYDSLLAKVICRAKSREECIVKMERALQEFIIEGVKTTIPFHLVLLNNPEFRSGKYDTGLLERFDYVKEIKNLSLS
jgi:acetyl-CoA carboxylase biotin carboxylase subunit